MEQVALVHVVRDDTVELLMLFLYQLFDEVVELLVLRLEVRECEAGSLLELANLFEELGRLRSIAALFLIASQCLLKVFLTLVANLLPVVADAELVLSLIHI